MFIVYILKSRLFGRFYIGHTKNLIKRLNQHNKNKVRSTKNKGPWEIVYTEKFKTKSEAYRREKQIKSYKRGEAFKKLFKK